MPAIRSETLTLMHLTGAERALLARVKAAVLADEPGAEIILYGSRARGDAVPDSDWDLLVLLDGHADRYRVQTVRNRVYDVEMDQEICPVLSTFVHGRDEWDSPAWRATAYHANVQREGVAL